MNVTLQGNDLELSDELRQYVDDKLQDCLRAFGDTRTDAIQIAIELTNTTRHHRSGEDLFRAEANVTVPGKLIRVEESAGDIHTAVSKMKETLTREIRRWRERKIEGKRKGGREVKSLLNRDEDMA